MPVINLNKTVYELCMENPELTEAMRLSGFENITKPGMLQSAGRFMTIPKGCRAKGIPLETVIVRLEEQGFTVENN